MAGKFTIWDPGTMRTSVAVVSWYASNVGVMLLNKYVLSSYNFKKPVFLTLCHMISCSLFANMTVALGTMPKKDVKTCRQGAKIAVLALVFCLSVVLGNVSLRFMPVSFNQAVGATSPFVTAVLSCLILGSKETARTYMALVPIVVGTMIASGFEPSFHFWGFLACICSSVFRGLKSIIQSVLLSSSADKLDSLNLLRYMAPIACLMLLPGVLILEGNAFDQAQAIAARYPSFYYAFFLNSFLAFFCQSDKFVGHQLHQCSHTYSAWPGQVRAGCCGVHPAVWEPHQLCCAQRVCYDSLWGHCLQPSQEICKKRCRRSQAR